MEIIMPYTAHRTRHRHPQALYDSPDSLSEEELEAIKAMTIAATPANKGLIKWFGRSSRLGVQAACLIRDTMKVATSRTRAIRPTAALFYEDPSDQNAGGTGHTIRVCQRAGVTVVLQSDWAPWI
jgi:hypothetical protein